MPSVKNSRKEGRKSQVLRDDDIQNRCNEDVPSTGATIQEIFSLFFSLSLCSYHTMFLSSYILESSKTYTYLVLVKTKQQQQQQQQQQILLE